MIVATLEKQVYSDLRTEKEEYTFDLECVDENLNYLSMYASITVPDYELHHLVAYLKARGKTPINKVAEALSETPHDLIVLRQYIYALMFKDIIDFEICTPLTPNSLIWISKEVSEMIL